MLWWGAVILGGFLVFAGILLYAIYRWYKFILSEHCDD
jgi:hypothetical protein